MEALLILLGLAVLALPVAVIVLIVAHARLRRDFNDLKAVVTHLQTAPASSPSAAQTTPPATETAPVPDQAPAPKPPSLTQATEIPPVPQVSAPAPPPEQPEPVAARTAPPEPAGPSPLSRLARWLQENWFYAAAAVSLALAGIFLVQYGVETGYLTPTMRVVAALVFGAALIAGGEMIRRRFGDDESSATAYLPSVLSGAGLVSLMGGVLAARLLYDLIDPGPALAALFGIALFGLLLGWRHGPLLAAVGLIGGMAAPFLVGGTSDTPQWLLVYFGLLTALGLGIDTLRRWAWVSVLSVGLGGAASAMLLLSAAEDETLTACFALFVVVLTLLATLIPARSLLPDHQGPCVTEVVLALDSRAKPNFPVLLTLVTLIGACVGLGYAALLSETTWWVSAGLSAALATLLILWSRGAPALQDLAALPVLTFLALVGAPELNATVTGALAEVLIEQEGLTEQRMPLDVTLVLGAATVIGLAAFWRSLQPARFGAVWAGAAALIAPLTGLALEFTWNASAQLGDWPWALHALALAALMVVKATVFARKDGQARLRAALATVSALACIAFALTLLLTQAALTLALAAVVVSAAALDRRFDLPQMTGFIVAGILALGYRLIVDPGLGWGFDAPVLEMLAAYGGTMIALLAALALLLERDRPRARVFLESAAWSVGGMTVSLTLYHAIENFVGHVPEEAHWSFGLYGAIWIGAALAQLERLKLGGALKWLRIALTVGFGLIAAVTLFLSLSLGNPLLERQVVHGPILLNTLAPAYLLPALLLGLGAWRLGHLPRWLRVGLAGTGLPLAIFWIGLVIRHAWQGGTAMHVDHGITEPELYSYTVALLVAGAGLFYQALASRSHLLRRAGVVVIGLAVAKVFLIDISGLAGLVRVFSFLLLGLSLAGLAWFNRWVQTRSAPPPGAP